MTTRALETTSCVTSAELVDALAAVDASRAAATVVGYGVMGRQYVKALRQLRVPKIRVCSRSAVRLEELRGIEGIEVVSGGIEALSCGPTPEELCVLATPIPQLVVAAQRVVGLGFRRLLIEKPIALSSNVIERLADGLDRQGVDAVCAYNRLAYPSFHEVRARAVKEGGITSCTYTLTEIIRPDWPQRFRAEELERWGISNSLHVIGMAHGLMGSPETWQSYRKGQMSWHPTGTVFVGSGVSDRDIPFTYHADWGSTGRWSIEVHTPVSSYRLCPLEQVFRKTGPMAEWEAIPVKTWSTDIKAGIVEEVAAMVSEDIRAMTPLLSVRQTAALTRYAEAVFGYAG